LKAKRGIIALSTRSAEYILAESGTSLNLQQDDDEVDRLWHGSVALLDNCGLGMDLCKIFCGDEDEAPSYAVFEDLRDVDTFKDKRIVTNFPYLRFLACVPLRSPLYNMVIGTYIVVDDKPREGLTENEMQFMIDMGVTVMDHLEAQRNNRKQYRSERMVKAIGLFIEGKSSLREWWLEGGHKTQQKVTKRVRNGATPLDVQADIEFGVQDPIEEFSNKGMEGLPDHDTRPLLSRSPSSSTLSHIDNRGGDGRPTIPNRDSMFSASDTTVNSGIFSRPELPRAASVTTVDTTEDAKAEHVRNTSVTFDMPHETTSANVSKELQEAVLTKDLKAIFSRASNLIREAGGVHGSIFYDASVGSFGGASQTDIMSQKAPGNFHVDDTLTANEDDPACRSSDTDTANKETVDYCNILGFSTRKRSSLKGHSPPAEHQTFPERILRTLLKRYPHGKVFNFDDDGSFSSSDTDNAYLGGEGNSPDEPRRFTNTDTTLKRRRISREAEAAALRNALPGARSIFWFPLWDSSRERWYAGSLVWSTNPLRMLCPIEDLAYLAAFGNSIMAEVARLSALVLTQMKTDFISSISHELRSPLHGVLASVEFLQETAMTEVQADMVNNISASGRVLLDTINHVLDFSKVNRRVKTKGTGSKRRSANKSRLSFQEHKHLDNTTEDSADMCVLSEEVLESVWAGRKLTKLAYQTPGISTMPKSQSLLGPAETPVTIITDIRWQPNWTYEIDPGAWSRILLNIFGNSMKYTQSGFIKISLTIENDTLTRGKKPHYILELKVKDSGKGISKEFLKNHLYKPFAQEDSLAVGAGLGLSIVRHIVQDLGGEISFTSEQGVGTEATVRLPLLARPIGHAIPDLADEVKGLTKGKRFGLDGFDRYPDISETPTGILPADVEGAMFLKSSVHEMLTEWFEMEPAIVSRPDKTASDVVVIMESGINSLVEKLQSYQSGSGPSTAIVLCSTQPFVSASMNYGSLKVFYVSQP
jgi:signal transduction histidine kinase